MWSQGTVIFQFPRPYLWMPVRRLCAAAHLRIDACASICIGHIEVEGTARTLTVCCGRTSYQLPIPAIVQGNQSPHCIHCICVWDILVGHDSAVHSFNLWYIIVVHMLALSACLLSSPLRGRHQNFAQTRYWAGTVQSARRLSRKGRD